MKILITGGTGFVGTRLTARLIQDGNEVTVLTRSGKEYEKGDAGISYLRGDPAQKGPLQEVIKNHDALINLAGAGVHGQARPGGIRVGHPQRTAGHSQETYGQWFCL